MVYSAVIVSIVFFISVVEDFSSKISVWFFLSSICLVIFSFASLIDSSFLKFVCFLFHLIEFPYNNYFEFYICHFIDSFSLGYNSGGLLCSFGDLMLLVSSCLLCPCVDICPFSVLVPSASWSRFYWKTTYDLAAMWGITWLVALALILSEPWNIVSE